MSSEGLRGPDTVNVGDVSRYELHGVLGRVSCEDYDCIVGAEGCPGAVNLYPRDRAFFDVLQLACDVVYALSFGFDEADISMLRHVWFFTSPRF